jgi:putative hemolysin
MEYLAFAIAVLFFILLEAFFSGSEIALVSVNKAKLNLLAKKDKIIRDFLNDTESYITLTLFGYTLSIVLATAFYTYFWMKLTEDRFPQLKGYEPLLAETILIFTLVLGEIVPKSLFLANAEFLTPLIVKILYPLKKVFYLVLVSAKYISQKITSFLGKGSKFLKRNELIKILVSGNVNLSETKRLLIANVLAFKGRRISEIVKPLHDVVMVSKDANVAQVIEKIKRSGYSKIPVYSGAVQNIVGYVHAYDLLKAKKDEPITKYIRPIKTIGEFETLSNVLKKFLESNEHIAIVVDERGVVIGLVTLEDIVEEITGELYETTKREEEEIKAIAPDKWIVNANMEVGELRRLLNIPIPEGIYSTLGGFIQYQLGYLPKKGTEITFNGYLFRIVDADEKKIKKVLIKKLS